MALGAIASTIGSYAASEAGQAALGSAVGQVWGRIFKKDQVVPVDDNQRQIIELLTSRPSDEEMKQAFALLEGRLLVSSVSSFKLRTSNEAGSCKP